MTRDEHYLTILAEECAEVAQRVSKALRFGLGEVQAGQPLTNAQRIEEELRDLSAVAAICEERGLVDRARATHEEVRAKKEKIERHFEISREHGRLVE